MKIGYVFSGGGIRCVAQLAIYQALLEEGIKPTRFSGTSAGALVAVLLSIGKNPWDILQEVSKASVLAAVRPAFNLRGLLDVEKALSFFLTDVPETFEQLPVPVSIGTLNVRSGKPVFFSEGSLRQALLASCCIPVIFNPVKIGEEYYIDGGPVNNLPAEPLLGKCDRILGVHTNPVDENYTFNSMRGLLERTFLLTVNTNVQQRKSLCDVFLEPPVLKNFKVFDFKKAQAIYDTSYTWVKEEMPRIKSRILKKTD